MPIPTILEPTGRPRVALGLKLAEPIRIKTWSTRTGNAPS